MARRKQHIGRQGYQTWCGHATGPNGVYPFKIWVAKSWLEDWTNFHVPIDESDPTICKRCLSAMRQVEREARR